MGKLDTVTVNGPEGDVVDWGVVDWVESRATYGGYDNGSSRRRT
jgi:hypothetical protein